MEPISKIFPGNCVPICFSANAAFLSYTAVMIRSVLDHATDDHNYDIVILYTDIPEEKRTAVLSMAEGVSNVSIRFVDISESIRGMNFFTGSVYTGTKYTGEAYYRLLIPSLMPTYDKVIYLDGDMLALADLAELYEGTDLTGYMLASSRDYGGICNCYVPGDPRREYREKTLGLKNIDNYIISGMLLFNPAEFNRRYSAEELMKFCASREWRQHDQDVLNVLCEDSLLIIDGAWDYVENLGSFNSLPDHLLAEYNETADHVKIVHFAGPRKPWRMSSAARSDDFWRTCVRTPFFNEIFFQINKNYPYKLHILCDLLGYPISRAYTGSNAYITAGKYYVGPASDFFTKIETLRSKDGMLTLEGSVNIAGVSEEEPIAVYVQFAEQKYRCTVTARECSEYHDEKLWYRGVPFEVTFPFSPEYRTVIRLVFEYADGMRVVCSNLRFSALCPINRAKRKYYYSDGLIFRTDGHTISGEPAGRRAVIAAERAYQKTLPWRMRLRRTAFFLHGLFSKKKIWLISDRYDAAGDNGEAFFRYLVKHPVPGVRPIFTVSADSPDFKRMKKVGETMDYRSRKYRFYRIYADAIISAHLDTPMCFDFEKDVFCDLVASQKIVFLQHGIIKDDLSAVYPRFARKTDIFVTSARAEYDSIVGNPNYASGPEYTKMTGLPRYDNLVDRKEKVISFVPTWRKYCVTNVKGVFRLNADFEDSAYFRFYHALLSDPRLKAAAEAHGYRFRLVQHHIMEETNARFSDLDGVEIVSAPNYNAIFAESAMLVTDYSSTAFDMAYLSKPILYCQFDREEFYSSHTYTEGYFDYERDGFGPVTYDLESTVQALLQAMESDCAQPDLYAARVETFFPYRDHNNSERILKEILALEEKMPTNILNHRSKS